MSKLNVISEDTDNSITETSSYYSAIDDASLNESSLKPYVRKTGSICIQPSEFNDKQNKEFEQVFDCFDIDGDDTITIDDLTKVYCALNAPKEKAKQYANDFIKNATNKESKSINYNQFSSYFCTTYYGHFSTYELLSVFNKLDIQKKGYLDINDFKRLDSQLNWSAKYDLTRMFNKIDENKDGKICFKEFMNLMNQN